jgi:glycosyltransferase involved in cell wall biosynthesis
VRAVRIYHSGVVTTWRARDRCLRQLGVDVKLLSAKRWDEGGAIVTSPPEDFVVNARVIGRHPYRFAYDPRPLRRLLRETLAIIDVHEEAASLAAGEVLLIAAITRAREPIVFYSAQNIQKRYPLPFRWFERWMFRRAAGAYVCNEAAADVLRAKGFGGRIEVIPLGVDLAAFAPTDPPPSPRVGYVGRLLPHKGVDVLLRAAQSLPSVAIDIYGDGPDRPRLEATARENRVSDRVTFHGFVDHARLPDVYRGLTAVAVPSLPTSRWVEQFCRVAVEAMASGRPVAASDSGALPEVVGPGGILHPPGDARALASSLARMIDPEENARLRAQAVSWSKRYDWAVIAEQHAALYRTVTA